MNYNGAIKEKLDIIERYYPGINALSDYEILKRKFFRSAHSFQFAIALKKKFEAKKFNVRYF